MATSPEFHEYVVDLLRPYYPITTRKMFGGVGIYCEYGMFALITSEDELYFKVDDVNRGRFEAAETSQFMRMPYYQLPLELMDAPDELGSWINESIEVARRSPKKKKK